MNTLECLSLRGPHADYCPSMVIKKPKARAACPSVREHRVHLLHGTMHLLGTTAKQAFHDNDTSAWLSSPTRGSPLRGGSGSRGELAMIYSQIAHGLDFFPIQYRKRCYHESFWKRCVQPHAEGLSGCNEYRGDVLCSGNLYKDRLPTAQGRQHPRPQGWRQIPHPEDSPIVVSQSLRSGRLRIRIPVSLRPFRLFDMIILSTAG